MTSGQETHRAYSNKKPQLPEPARGQCQETDVKLPNKKQIMRHYKQLFNNFDYASDAQQNTTVQPIHRRITVL